MGCGASKSTAVDNAPGDAALRVSGHAAPVNTTTTADAQEKATTNDMQTTTNSKQAATDKPPVPTTPDETPTAALSTLNDAPSGKAAGGDLEPTNPAVDKSKETAPRTKVDVDDKTPIVDASATDTETPTATTTDAPDTSPHDTDPRKQRASILANPPNKPRGHLRPLRPPSGTAPTGGGAAVHDAIDMTSPVVTHELEPVLPETTMTVAPPLSPTSAAVAEHERAEATRIEAEAARAQALKQHAAEREKTAHDADNLKDFLSVDAEPSAEEAACEYLPADAPKPAPIPVGR
eukprot:m.187544 g.187544  ORF g.187544 m.187544 type:complete len:292 (-) comp17115_c0_seq1:202-1077(-)